MDINMIFITGSNSSAIDIVHAAICRSCSSAQVHKLAEINLQDVKNLNCLVMIDPQDEHLPYILSAKKVLLLGRLSPAIANHVGAETQTLSETTLCHAHCESAPIYQATDSRLKVVYQRSLGELSSPITERAFLHYDFQAEWNNLGFGAIRVDNSIWSLSHAVNIAQKNVLANVMCEQDVVTTYAALWDTPRSSILWFNREVGPIDSQEWRLVEYFFASYRHAELPCIAVLSEIPHGFDAAVTMRLDCDEDIESARTLFEKYQQWHVPFSLAIHTAVLNDTRHIPLIHEVIAKGGAILSHSATHPVNWGGSYANALIEAKTSLAALNEVVSGKQIVKYAVSPFHQTPAYALKALSAANYAGCVGGIVCNAPEFLLARAGNLFDCPPGFIGHSQACMLHGDCMLDENDPLRIYKQAFDIAKRGRAFFGFLDHPFSDRYAYGWQDEKSRADAHEKLIAYIRAQGNVLFLNENDALDFLALKASVQLSTRNSTVCLLNNALTSKWDIDVEFRGKLIKLSSLNEVPA